MITSIRAGFLSRLFPANLFSFFYFDSLLITFSFTFLILITFNWLKKIHERKVAPIEVIM